jgi:nicotinamide mononucleotide transporter
MIDAILTPIQPWQSLPWLAMSPLEIVATIFGLWSVWAYTRQSMWAWPSGLINVVLFIVLFWNSQLYGETGLQVVFVVLQIYGWWCWWRGTGTGDALPITRTSPRLWTVLAAVSVAGIVPLGLFLQHGTTSTTPWWDAVPTILSLVAQWMISKKKLENWYVWIVVDIFSIPLFAYKELYLVSMLYAVFLVLCILGVRQWTKTYRSSAAA